MKWTDSLATGVPLLDRQHRALFDCIGVLEKAAAEGRFLATMSAIEKLNVYARTHLAEEESLMVRYGFPRLEQHRAEHEEFKAMLYKLRLTNTQCDNTKEIVRFLSDWLHEHVSKRDLEYVPYLRKDAA
jgi:hemerythrin